MNQQLAGTAGTMEWLRLYTEARNDAKLRSLSDRQFRVWFNLLCLAGEQSDRGIISGYTEHLLAVEVAGGDTGALQETCIALQALRSVTSVTCPDGTVKITFLKFANRQYVKPSDTPERVRDRVRKSRKNKKLREEMEKQSKPVTPPYRDVTPPETETDSELSERDAGANKPENPPDDDPVELDGPIGPNTAAQVREALWTARELYPDTALPVVARQWLADHAAARVIAAVSTARDAKAASPIPYVETLLNDPAFPKAKKPPRDGARPEPPYVPPTPHVAPPDSPMRRKNERDLAEAARRRKGAD